ncbi:choice-of-anchor B family protein [Parashewanella spongiae]|uniref:Choice-of-anchor B family protein n=1 Tax=Parashewanella spongiae TaxID=342950 RepID=A0A3A6U1E9_9GAMM|nr:choice-of-anchor B family protein [Parashewanella spongiae]
MHICITSVWIAFCDTPNTFQYLRNSGFHVVNDGIARYGARLKDRLKNHADLQNSHRKTSCVDGKAGNFNCSNIDLVSHMSLGDFSSNPPSANDIWGHVDLNTGTEYAIIGLRNGTSVVSLEDPESPREVGFITGTSTSWRDIKVYQWFDEASLSWKANAYVGSEGSNYIHIIDLSQLPDSVSKLNTDKASLRAHNVYISNVDYTTNTALEGASPSLHLVGQNVGGGEFRNYSLADPSKLQIQYARSGNPRSFYTHDASSMLVKGARAESDCNSASCAVLFDFNEEEMRIWNISDPTQVDELSNITYQNASYVHSGWWSEDKQYVFVHDELDEQNHGLNTTVRVFDINNLQTPRLVKTWTGPSKAIDHNGFVRGNRYYMSNYQRGVTVLDISDAADPKHIGYFDTYPASDSNAFNGVWGVYPYLPSGLIIASDINSGLYILKDNTLASSSGSVSFERKESLIIPGNTARLTIQRPEGRGAVSVGYETLAASAESDVDFQPQSGRLNWEAGDNRAKSIELVSLDSGKNKELLVFVRLFDPKGGLTLTSPSYHTLKVGVNPIQAGTISFLGNDNVVNEGDGSVSVKVARTGGSSGSVKVNYHLQSGTASVGEDVVEVSGELEWSDGDNQLKTITVWVWVF